MKNSRYYIFLFFIISFFDISCSAHDDEIDAIIDEADTVWVPQVIYDTIYKDSLVHDTIIKDSLVHDTVYIDSLIHDTIIVDNIVNDTIIIDRVIHDTIIIEHGLDKIRVAQWNLGHFALGKSYDTKISQDRFTEMQRKWTETISNIDADVFCCCEYNTNFVNSGNNHDAVTAREALFPQYQFAYIGSKPYATSYMQTAIFSRLPIKNIKQHVYRHTVQSGRYFQYGDLSMNGKTVKVVATHLDFNQGANGAAYRKDQINELMDFFSSDPFVIICADWNGVLTSYGIIEESGYTIANRDVNTYPSGSSPQWPLDNIICKGFDISAVRFVNDASLTDHAAIYAEFTIIDESKITK